MTREQQRDAERDLVSVDLRRAVLDVQEADMGGEPLDLALIEESAAALAAIIKRHINKRRAA